MKIKTVHALMLGALGIASTSVFGADVYLCAGVVDQTLPPMAAGATEPVTVPMWGYGEDAGVTVSGEPCNVQVPGPQINVDPADPSLVIHLRNELPVATSVMITGQYMAEDATGAMLPPVMTTNTSGKDVVRSLTGETAPGAQLDYHFNALKPGTHAYKSATHMTQQLQMGLYGALVHDAPLDTLGNKQGYTGLSYDVDQVMLYSEIDPSYHTAVTVAPVVNADKQMPSTVHYHAEYFLINGEAFIPAQIVGATATLNPPAPLTIGDTGQKTLLRMINMGQETHIPVINNGRFYLVAEDNNLYHHMRNQYSAVLGAGQTKDVLFAPVNDGSYVMYDGVLNVTNGQQPYGGMIAFLDVPTGGDGSNSSLATSPTAPPGGGGSTGGGGGGIPPTTEPVANKDIVTTAAGQAINIIVRDNDVYAPVNDIQVRLVTGRTARSDTIDPTRRGGVVMVNQGDNSLSYTPPPGFSGSDVFKYVIYDATLGVESNKGKIRVNIQ